MSSGVMWQIHANLHSKGQPRMHGKACVLEQNLKILHKTAQIHI